MGGPALAECGDSTGTLIRRLAAASYSSDKTGGTGADIYDFKAGQPTGLGSGMQSVKDATGAGDTFNGGFLSAWCRTGDWKSSGTYGAALTCASRRLALRSGREKTQ